MNSGNNQAQMGPSSSTMSEPPLAGGSFETYLQISQFLYREARALYEERFRDWLSMMTSDIHYWLPVRENRYRRDRRPEPTPKTSASVYNEDFWDLEMRVKRMETGLV